MYKSFLCGIAAWAVLVLPAAAAEKPAITVWAANPLDKVFTNTPVPPQANTRVVTVDALRNEYEPAMICVTSNGYAGPLKASVTPLVHKNGSYSIKDVNVRFVGYIKTPPKSADNKKFPFADSPESYPDPLLPDESVELKNNCTQPIWITVKVPSDAPAGKYQGAIEVITDQGKKSIALNLTVYPVTLPEEPFFQLGSWGGDCKLSEYFQYAPVRAWVDGQYTDAQIEFFKNGSIKNRRDHRARLFTDQPFWEMDLVKVYLKNNQIVYDYSKLDKLISTVEAAYAPGWFKITCLGVIDLTTAANGGEMKDDDPFTSSIRIFNPDGSLNEEKSIKRISTNDPRYRAYITDFFKAMKEHLQSRNWLDKVYFKILDEPTNKLVPPVLELGDFIKKSVPGIQLDLTYWEPATGVQITNNTSVDVLIPNSWMVDVSKENLDAVKAAAAAGRTVLLYNDPKVSINEPLLLTRKIGWQCFDIKAKGYMHWAYCWKNAWDDAYDANWGFGAHYVVYPDVQRKVIVDSIRWEMLREAAEDFDTLVLLKKAGGNSKKYAALVNRFKGSADEPAKFARIRKQVLQELARGSK